jgi:hypothetical protein
MITLMLTAALFGCGDPSGVRLQPPTEPPVDVVTVGDLRFVASSREVAGVGPATTFEAHVNVANIGSEPLVVWGVPCPIIVRVYRTANRDSAPIYDSSANFDPCQAIQKEFVLEPGQTEVFSGKYIGSDVLGRSATRGRYYITTRLRLSRPELITSELVAGDLVLHR